eukprot:Anaeramoba_flamelloidesa812791_26.p1 GENE.a812791_26~~a812791_26.p1  ORF type:complete len:139 (-),score=54.45 a812791_26:175-591(-)
MIKKWKLNNSQNDSRQRKKLKINNNFVKHLSHFEKGANINKYNNLKLDLHYTLITFYQKSNIIKNDLNNNNNKDNSNNEKINNKNDDENVGNDDDNDDDGNGGDDDNGGNDDNDDEKGNNKKNNNNNNSLISAHKLFY